MLPDDIILILFCQASVGMPVQTGMHHFVNESDTIGLAKFFTNLVADVQGLFTNGSLINVTGQDAFCFTISRDTWLWL